MDPSNWQTELPSIRERNEYAFNKSLFCDVEFSVVDSNGVKITIPANKYVLAISSPVFEAMFYGQLAESKPTIDLPDCTKEGLQEMLRYVYSDGVNLTGSNVMEVLYLADKYMMPPLKEKCKKSLLTIVDSNNVLSILPQVQKVDEKEIQKQLWEIIDCETRRTLSSKSFLNVSREILFQILVRDTLHISELELFFSVGRWVEERIKEKGLESNGETKRSILGEEVIRLIRFPVMKEKNFALYVLPCNILEKDEVVELVQDFNEVSHATNMFIGKKRSLDCLFIPSVRFDNIKSPDKLSVWKYHGKKEVIAFSANKSIYLVGIQMFGSLGSKYNVELNIYKCELVIRKQLPSHFLTRSGKIDDKYYGFTVNLDKPVRLDPGVVYAVETKISGPPSYYGESGKATMSIDNNVVITFETSWKCNLSNTNIHNGQFPSFIFRKVSDS